MKFVAFVMLSAALFCAASCDDEVSDESQAKTFYFPTPPAKFPKHNPYQCNCPWYRPYCVYLYRYPICIAKPYHLPPRDPCATIRCPRNRPKCVVEYGRPVCKRGPKTCANTRCKRHEACRVQSGVPTCYDPCSLVKCKTCIVVNRRPKCVACPDPKSFGRTCITYKDQCQSDLECRQAHPRQACCLVAGCGHECMQPLQFY